MRNSRTIGPQVRAPTRLGEAEQKVSPSCPFRFGTSAGEDASEGPGLLRRTSSIFAAKESRGRWSLFRMRRQGLWPIWTCGCELPPWCRGFSCNAPLTTRLQPGRSLYSYVWNQEKVLALCQYCSRFTLGLSRNKTPVPVLNTTSHGTFSCSTTLERICRWLPT